MIFQPMTVTDKTGHPVLLRKASPDDAENLLRYLKVTAGETPFLLREPEEVTMTPEQEQGFIRRMADADRELMILAECDGVLMGSGSLMCVGGLQRLCHRCELSVALYQEFCGRGVGTIMMQVLLQTAAQAGYEQAELEVVADNRTALALYETLGFTVCGRLPRYLKYRDGTYADAIRMTRIL